MTEKINKPFYDDKDYRREYKLRETDLIGIYTPADQQHPAYSAPPPDYTNAFSRDMTSQYLKYHCECYSACQNYMLLASDSRRLEYAMTAQELFFPPSKISLMTGKAGSLPPTNKS